MQPVFKGVHLRVEALEHNDGYSALVAATGHRVGILLGSVVRSVVDFVADVVLGFVVV